jgi:hypothetical protein
VSAPPLTDRQAVTRIADLLDGRVWKGGDDLDSIAAIVRQAGREVRDPAAIAVRCPNCGGMDVVLDYEATVSVQVTADRVQRVTLAGFTGTLPLQLVCFGCDQEFPATHAQDLAVGLAEQEAESTVEQEVLAADRLVRTLDAAAELIPDRFADEIDLQGEGA